MLRTFFMASPCPIGAIWGHRIIGTSSTRAALRLAEVADETVASERTRQPCGRTRARGSKAEGNLARRPNCRGGGGIRVTLCSPSSAAARLEQASAGTNTLANRAARHEKRIIASERVITPDAQTAHCRGDLAADKIAAR